jgi:NAD(P)-dependent dehydrogenase (short-subunit alcohol dehydrogenase family)
MRRGSPSKGVIMTVTSIPARTGTLLQGGYPPAMAAKEALTRDLSAELAPRAFVWSGCDHTGSGNRHAQGSLPASCHGMGMTWEQWQESLASRTHPRRLSTLAELAEVAVFMASDKASGMTGTTVNLTMGSLDD